MTKTGQECVSISTDGYCHFWDTRKLKEERVESLEITEFNSEGKEVLVGGTTLENSSEAVSIFYYTGDKICDWYRTGHHFSS
jgi:hypothetical protein